MYKLPIPKKLVSYIRNGLIEQEHCGYVCYIPENSTEKTLNLGQDNNYPFYLRSCAKPLQATLLTDFGMDKEFCMSEEEIAICCASHAGEKIHTDILEGLLKKIDCKPTDLLCKKHPPLSKTRQLEMFKTGEDFNELHNNCSGKHIMMLGICKIKGWDIKTYNKLEHPLQQAIVKNITELCELTQKYPITKDGCTVPIMSMPLKNMVKGFINLSKEKRYNKITNSIMNNPYIMGGENRTDTKILANSKNLIAKVGAGGLCIVVNTLNNSGFVVKISDCNMDAREIFLLDFLKQLNWANIDISHDIKTLDNEIVGKIVTNTHI